MARKFFNQKVDTNRSAVVKISVVIGILLLLFAFIMLMVHSVDKRKNKSVVKLRDSVSIEINTKLPDDDVFFVELKNVKKDDIKVNMDSVRIDKIGTYDVKISIKGSNYKSAVKVVDTKKPELKLKNVSIKFGEKYEPKDFVESCNDNSKAECEIKFYELATTEDGNKIDYGSYTKEGTYEIQITAMD